MPQGSPILVAVAWPYANTPLHAGQMAGAYLPADIFARYQRARGREVLMVSGSDAHGTPITVRAEQEGSAPEAIAQRNHQSFLDTFDRFGISFDLFTSTATENHARVAQDLFTRLLERDYIYEAQQTLLYDPKVGRFLPDRYVEGTCPRCGAEGARGDQCDSCGATLDALELIDPRSKLSDATPEPRETNHFFLRLSAFNDQLTAWVEQQEHWRPAVRNFTLGQLREGLHDRAITRDLAWGVPVPLPGYDDKRIYVWFEAVIGYLSASIEWAERTGDAEAWRRWWSPEADPPPRSYYFQGKDNIPFHTMIWPAMLMGAGDLALPYDVPANQYVTISGSKASSSRNWAIWMPDYLERHEPDPLRYALAAIMPETSDSDFSWAEYVRRNNDELVARWGNLVQRVLTLTHRHFEGVVPERPANPDPASAALLGEVRDAFETVGGHIEALRFRAALGAAMGVAQSANRYLDERAPWKTVKTDRNETAETLVTALDAISGIAALLHPFLPHTSPRAWAMVGHAEPLERAGWVFTPLTPGTALPDPAPLFTKLDPEAFVAEEEARLGA